MKLLTLLMAVQLPVSHCQVVHDNKSLWVALGQHPLLRFQHFHIKLQRLVMATCVQVTFGHPFLAS